ncbi:MAG: glycosyltransferase family 4 protein [Pseudorhodoplanes sp.]|uniref:glycosyltransferase family 4 protein n=1 Tax=Pseudorhodoplanes sp. TaxID=1934341 RepID=UPI003D0FAFD0
MRVLFLARLFAGLKSGLAKGQWEPGGVPAIYRLIEGLAADRDVDLLSVFCVKEPDSRFPKRLRRNIPVIGDTVILPYASPFGGRARRVTAARNEAMHAARMLALAARFKPDVIYANYTNILPAALLARAGYRVVLRLMGVQSHHRDIAAGKAPFFRWQMRSPFAHVVCTEDGSDPAALIPNLVRAETPWTVRLNGCDAKPLPADQVRAFRNETGLGERPVVLFLGRLEPYKGAVEFIEAAIAMLRSIPDGADVVVVGDGPLRDEMEARVNASGVMARIRFAGAQPHARVNLFLNAADVYVSTNMYGNLSNANLEALAAGACLVFPTSDPLLPLDTVTDRLLPPGTAARYARNELPASLADALCQLVRSPEEIVARRGQTGALAQQIIRPWSDVVANDIALLKSVVARRPDFEIWAETNRASKR